MNAPPQVTVAICCYNAAEYLPKLFDQLVKQSCPLSWEILVIDNNSTDNSETIINDFAKSSIVPIRMVKETQLGIPFARNRAISESWSSTFLAFIDSDELPDTNWLATAITSLQTQTADSVGGEIELDLSLRPAWLSDSLLPFLGQVNYGNHPFPIQDRSTPIWSGNIAYRLSLFAGTPPFDTRYTRKGKGIGGGSDGILFRQLLASGAMMLYEPEMRIKHIIPKEKLTRRYFLKLHFIAGKKSGLYELSNTQGTSIFGVPRYMFLLFIKKILTALKFFTLNHSEYMREAMNAAHLLGQIIGLYLQTKSEKI